jgi:hypothetical protein
VVPVDAVNEIKPGPRTGRGCCRVVVTQGRVRDSVGTHPTKSGFRRSWSFGRSFGLEFWWGNLRNRSQQIGRMSLSTINTRGGCNYVTERAESIAKSARLCYTSTRESNVHHWDCADTVLRMVLPLCSFTYDRSFESGNLAYELCQPSVKPQRSLPLLGPNL